MMAEFDITKERKGSFLNNLNLISPGDKIIYHQGSYCAGSHREDAMMASNKGFAALIQKRLGKANFMYIAIRTKKKINYDAMA
tara:strand:- start:122 stop:370 length:249 start_codon:yes stop_codon:yes gene_type:complete